jgi:cytochrome P450
VTQYFLAVAVRNGESPIFISKGLKVLYSTYSMHRRRDIWGADADEFRPERWVGARAFLGKKAVVSTQRWLKEAKELADSF